jgi:uncharacterized membrane protein YdjX (TVP38/TMEM64 family)
MPTEPDAPRPWAVRVIAACGPILLTIALIAAIPQLRHAASLAIHGDLGGLRAYVRGLGFGGAALLLLLMLLHAIVFYPSEVVTATAGFVYGFLPGVAFVMIGWLVSALLSFWLGRHLARPVSLALLGHRFAALESAVQRGGTRLLLVGRLIPVIPFSLLGYVAGAARVPLSRFAWTTAVGFLPLTVAVAYLGSRAQTLSAGDPAVWLAAGVLVALIVASRFITVTGPDRRGDG